MTMDDNTTSIMEMKANQCDPLMTYDSPLTINLVNKLSLKLKSTEATWRSSK